MERLKPYLTKDTARYREFATETKQCQTCTMFRVPDKCTLVQGHISRTGTCDHYKRKAK